MSFLDKISSAITTVEEVKNTFQRSIQIKASDGSALDRESIKTKFDLSMLKRVDSGYLLTGDNRTIFTGDALLLNQYIKEARSLIKNIPAYEIHAKDLVFTEKIENGCRRNVFLVFTPKTKTGRMPKYPVEVHFTVSSDQFFGVVYYGQSLQIEKGEIVMWKGSMGYIIDLAMIDGNLAIKEIYRNETTTGNKYKVYYQ